MVDLELLKARGITKAKLRKLFESEKPTEKIKTLKEILRNRLTIGIHKNWAEAKFFKSIDTGYDQQLDQVKWTFIQNLSRKKLDATQLAKELMDYGMEHLIKPYCPTCKSFSCSPGCTAQKGIAVDLPAFYDVLVGLIPAYLKVRWSKLCNDRDQIPFYPYDPLKLTLKEKIKSEVVTSRVQLIADQFDYRSDRRQKVFQTLLYGSCLQAVVEEWYKEKQTFIVDDKEKTLTVKEGLRYCFPHPTRWFIDEAYRPNTLNSNTGVSYFGYWHLTTWGQFNREQGYFNKDKIKYQNPEWAKEMVRYSDLYPCSMKWPCNQDWWVESDRETKFIYYGQRGLDKDEDLTMLVCNLPMKLIPSEWGLGNYDSPVWFRFVLGSEDTVVYAAPLPYTPGSFYGYDYDGNRARNASMAVEIYPFQTLLSNLLSQLIYSVEQNLIRIVYFNQDIVDEKVMGQLKGAGSRLHRGINFAPFSGRELIHGQNSINQAFFSPTFPQHNIQEAILAIQTTINILERVLQFSSQELGVAATHEQSATESNIISQHQSDRLRFTGGFIDDGEHSDKIRLYEATMAYSDDEIFAEIAELNDQTRAAVKEMGWTVEEEQTDGGGTRAGIRGSKKVLRLQTFTSTRGATEKLNNPGIAASMVQLAQLLTQNPLILNAIGVPQVVEWFNEIFAFAGVPRDFRIRVTNNKTPEEQSQELQKQIVEISQKVTQQQLEQLASMLGDKVFKPMQDAIAAIGQKTVEQEQVNAAQQEDLAKITQILAQLQPPPPIVPMPVPALPLVDPTMAPAAPPQEALLGIA